METPFEEMKRFVEFTVEDSLVLREFHPIAVGHFGWLTDRFYAKLSQHEGARRVFTGPEQVARLKESLRLWADRLFYGPHDEEYYRLRSNIGRVHVRIGLQQMYMFTAMNVIRDSLQQVVFRELQHDEPQKARVMAALEKLIDMELAIMLETYQQDVIAKLQRTEQQAAVQRLASIGEVAASVAHEVRNPLAGISGAVEVIRDRLPDDSPHRDVIKEVLALIRRLDDRVRDLLHFARPVSLTLEQVDLAELSGAALAVLANDPLMRQVRAHVSVPADLGTHPMDRGQIMEVLLNLLQNAAEAMGGGGDLYIEATRKEGGSLELAVEDTGPGVPAARRDEIFRPFFTSRAGGTGLGLSIARKTLDAHGGHLWCESGRRGGARFVVVLPPAVVTR